MRFAMMDGRRVEAKPRQSGHCPICAKPMIAKCGTQVVWHWAHKGARCDDWWEPETAWHRAWKDEFPVEWQESVCEGDGGQRHIADVLTGHSPSRRLINVRFILLRPTVTCSTVPSSRYASNWL